MRPLGKGRKKTELKKIEKKSALIVSFSKRRSGLFGKINRMAEADGFNFVMVVFSPGGRAFTTGDPSLIDDYCLNKHALEAREVARAVPAAVNGAIMPYRTAAVATSPDLAYPLAMRPAPLAERAAFAPCRHVAAPPIVPPPPAPAVVQASLAAQAEVSEEDLREYMRCLNELGRRVADRIGYVERKERLAKSKKRKNMAEVYLQDPVAQD